MNHDKLNKKDGKPTLNSKWGGSSTFLGERGVFFLEMSSRYIVAKLCFVVYFYKLISNLSLFLLGRLKFIF